MHAGQVSLLYLDNTSLRRGGDLDTCRIGLVFGKKEEQKATGKKEKDKRAERGSLRQEHWENLKAEGGFPGKRNERERVKKQRKEKTRGGGGQKQKTKEKQREPRE